MNQKTPRTPNRILYVKSHLASLGVFLAFYGAFFLSTVILNQPITTGYERFTQIYSPITQSALFHHNLLNSSYFATSLPALIIGAIMLNYYSIKEITPQTPENKQYLAVALTALGFAYQVIGAWPLQRQTDFPWQWQKQIVSLGLVFAWALYILSLVTLIVGVVSLYKHSVIYHQKQPPEETEND